jgi:hypothetical protein
MLVLIFIITYLMNELYLIGSSRGMMFLMFHLNVIILHNETTSYVVFLIFQILFNSCSISEVRNVWKGII